MKPRLAKGLKSLGALVLLACLGINALAYLQAGAMTHWAEGHGRTERPEDLSLARRLRVLLLGVSIPRPENRLTPKDVGLAFERHAFPNGQGAELEAWFVPLKEALEEAHVEAHVLTVLFHGHAACKDSMLGIAKGLNELGSSVLLVDFHGSGGSSGSGTSLGVHEAHDVAATAAYARAHWPDRGLVLYGQSMGGAAVLRAVARLGVAPDGLVLESTFDRLLATVASRFRRMGLPATPLAQLLVFWGSLRIGANGFAHNPAEYARSVRCPTLVLRGDRDPNISSDQARRLLAGLGGWTRYSEYAKVGHQDIRSADPRRWQDDVGALLTRLSR